MYILYGHEDLHEDILQAAIVEVGLQPADVEQIAQTEEPAAPIGPDVPTIEIANDVPSSEEVYVSVPLSSLLDTADTPSTQPQTPTGTARLLTGLQPADVEQIAQTEEHGQAPKSIFFSIQSSFTSLILCKQLV